MTRRTTRSCGRSTCSSPRRSLKRRCAYALRRRAPFLPRRAAQLFAQRPLPILITNPTHTHPLLRAPPPTRAHPTGASSSTRCARSPSPKSMRRALRRCGSGTSTRWRRWNTTWRPRGRITTNTHHRSSRHRGAASAPPRCRCGRSTVRAPTLPEANVHTQPPSPSLSRP